LQWRKLAGLVLKHLDQTTRALALAELRLLEILINFNIFRQTKQVS
jgi:hypothetical protein